MGIVWACEGARWLDMIEISQSAHACVVGAVARARVGSSFCNACIVLLLVGVCMYVDFSLFLNHLI